MAPYCVAAGLIEILPRTRARTAGIRACAHKWYWGSCDTMICLRVWVQALGSLLPGVARELGLSEDVVVSPGSGDNAMSALGAGAPTSPAHSAEYCASHASLMPRVLRG